MDGQLVSQVPMGAAAAAGLAAALLMVGLSQALRAGGATRFDVLLLMGTIFAPPGSRARLLGLAWYLTSGLAFGVIYATLFEFLGVAPGWRAGAAFGLVHGLLSGLSLGTLPFRNRRVAVGEVADPGIFALNFGYPDAAALLGGRVIFGIAFGLIYPPLSGL